MANYQDSILKPIQLIIGQWYGMHFQLKSIVSLKMTLMGRFFFEERQKKKQKLSIGKNEQNPTEFKQQNKKNVPPNMNQSHRMDKIFF